MRYIGTVLIFILLMGCLVLAVLLRPASALGGILCTYALEQWAQTQSSFFAVHGTLVNYTTGGILILALMVTALRGRNLLANYPAVSWVIMSLYGLAVLSVLWSVYRQGTIEQWRRHLPYIIVAVGLTPLLVVHPRDIYNGLITTMALGAVTLLLLVFTTEWRGRGVDVGYYSKQVGNPLATASLGGYVAIVALLMNYSGIARIWQVLRWFLFCLGVVICIMSGSRGQFLAMLIVILMFLPVSRRFRSLKGLAGTIMGFMLAGGLVAWAYSSYAGSSRWNLEEMVESYQGTRMYFVATLLETWAESSPMHWIIGLGNSASYDPRIVGTYPHLVAAEVLAEEGLIGLILWCTIMTLVARAIVRVYRMTHPFANARGVLAALAGLFMFQLILSFKQGSLLGHTYMFMFAIMLGKFEGYMLQLTAAGEPET